MFQYCHRVTRLPFLYVYIFRALFANLHSPLVGTYHVNGDVRQSAS